MFFSLFAKMIYCSADYRPVLPIDRLWVVKCQAFLLYFQNDYQYINMPDYFKDYEFQM